MAVSELVVPFTLSSPTSRQRALRPEKGRPQRNAHALWLWLQRFHIMAVRIGGLRFEGERGGGVWLL